jgi:hypothetical protein
MIMIYNPNNMTNQTLLVGCDPELFIADTTGIMVSAHDLLPGTKAKPFPVPYGAIQVDGMAAEFNIDPAHDEEEWTRNISAVMSTLTDTLPKDFSLQVQPTCTFTRDVLSRVPEESLELGCDPDFNAYFRMPNPAPDSLADFRTAAGHVHLGWIEGALDSPEHEEDALNMALQMDMFLGLPSLTYDSDSKRRELYGKAGAFRSKEYGCEYRTLSNMWLSSPKLISLVYRNAVQGAKAFLNGVTPYAKYGRDIQKIIDNSDVKAAITVMESEGINYAKC